MSNFVKTVSDFFLQEKGINVADMDYMEMPVEREKYNFSNVVGNVSLTEGRFITKSEADALIDEFLSMPIP